MMMMWSYESKPWLAMLPSDVPREQPLAIVVFDGGRLEVPGSVQGLSVWLEADLINRGFEPRAS